MEAHVKYTMFHAGTRRKYAKNASSSGTYYNAGEGDGTAPGQMRYTASRIRSGIQARGGDYRAANCKGCPLRGMCYSARSDRRTIEVNYRADAFKRRARGLPTSGRGIVHRSKRPTEPEAVFGGIKFNHGFRRFRIKSNRKVRVGSGPVALAHDLRKYPAMLPGRKTGGTHAFATV